MPSLIAALSLLLLLASPVAAAQGEPWVDGDRFKKDPAAPPAQSAPRATPKASPKPAPAAKPPDYGDQAAIERRRQARLAYTQALDEFNAGHYAQASRLLQQHLAVFPENGQAREYLAMALRLHRAQSHGTLKVLSQPPGQVMLDGRLLGNTPLTLTEVPVGRHFLQADSKGVRQGREVVIKPMTITTVEFDLHPPEVHIEVIRPGSTGTR